MVAQNTFVPPSDPNHKSKINTSHTQRQIQMPNSKSRWQRIALIGIGIFLVGFVAGWFIRWKSDWFGASSAPSAITHSVDTAAQRMTLIPQITQQNEQQTILSTRDPSANASEASMDYDPYYYAKAFDFAWPKLSIHDVVLENEIFTVGYDPANKEPIWAAGMLTALSMDEKSPVLGSRFVFDAELTRHGIENQMRLLKTHRLEPLMPVDLLPLTRNQNTDTEHAWLMRNASKQSAAFSEQVWRPLGKWLQNKAHTSQPLYVVVGKKNNTFFCVLLDLGTPSPQSMAFAIPYTNEQNKYADLMTYATSIDQVETITELDFFHRVPQEIQNQVEQQTHLVDNAP